jgi:hypothetical protein
VIPSYPATPRAQQQKEILPVGTLVRLSNAATGLPGVVEGSVRRKVVIRWPGLGFTGRYRPSTLLVVGAANKPPEAATPAKLKSYQRLLQNLDWDNGRS